MPRQITLILLLLLSIARPTLADPPSPADIESQARQNTASTDAKIFRQSFLITIPTVDLCNARPTSDSDQTPLSLSPLLPMGGRLPTLGTSPRSLPITYGGGGTLEELKGKPIANTLVALDIDAPESIGWQRCASLGAAGIIFLGDSHSPAANFLNKSTSLPLGIPRFYTDDPATIHWLKTTTTPITIELKTTWQEVQKENIICYLPGRGSGDWINQWVILQTRYDASSQVMSRAPGATPALNAAGLLELASLTAAAPTHCGVVLVWTAGDEWNYRGTREFLDLIHRGKGTSAPAIAFLQQKREQARLQLADAESLLKAIQKIQAEGWSAQPPEITIPALDPMQEELLRQSSALEEIIESAPNQTSTAETQQLKQKKKSLLAATTLINAGTTQPTPETSTIIKDAATKILDRWTPDLDRLRRQRDTLENWPDIRTALPTNDPLLFLSLALTGSRTDQPNPAPLKFGLLSRSYYSTGLDVSGPMSAFSISFRRYGENAADRFLPASLENAYALPALLPLKLGFSSDAAIARGLPAAALATLLDPNTFFDTPNDTPENLDAPQIQAQEQSITRFLLGPPDAPGLLTDPLFYARVSLPVLTSDQSLTVYERAIGQNLPQLKAAQTLVGGESEIYSHPLGEQLEGTRRTDWYLTHADGTADFHSVMRPLEAELRLQIFQYDASGQVIKALASNQSQSNGMVASFYPNAGVPRRAMIFDCTNGTLDAYGLFDPRYLDTLDQLQLLDARRLSDAQFFSIYTRQGSAAIFMPPATQTRWQLLASRGNVSNRMITIGADAKNPTGTGFDSTNLATLGPLPWRAAQDFLTLDQKRKTDLETFGISNEIIRDLHAASETQLAAAQSANTTRDYPAAAAATNALLSMQSQEYQTLIDTSNGIIKGVIFLLLGVIPFSYFLERLVIGSANVYRQITWFGIIFLCMTFGLWFHPAFRISSAPLMILLAFFILILSSTVVYILWGKFEEEIRLLRGTAGEDQHIESFRRGAVLGAAIRLGLSNMRRRAMRTTLTLITLVLLTFTLLCFTSVRETVQVSPHPVDYFATHPAPPPGILIRQRAWAELPPETLQFARGLTLTQDSSLKTQTSTIAPRYWYASDRSEQPWLLPIQSSTQTYFVSGLLGLSPQESHFQPDNPITAQLAGDTCWLPEKARDTLHLNIGDIVSILGFPLKVAGFFSPESFAQLRQLSGDPLSPIDPAGEKTISSGGTAAQDQSLRPESAYHFLPSISTAIVPAKITQQLNARLTSVMIRPPETENQTSKIENSATDLARRSAFTLYASTGARVIAINAAEATQPQDLSTVLIPMIIAGIIVLNTMLGAVSERTREIHVYTSVGLSPSHVGMLFLAEAAALGTLGIVFGYIFGQALATLLSWTHLLPGVDLNYSSMSAIFTMGSVLALVMLSSLWPAHAASRLAAPSLQREWKLPRPVGDVLSVDLPFTVNATAAKGTLAFLAEFLSTTSAAGTGRFTADNLAVATSTGTLGVTRALAAKIWLAPFDLGVIQTMRLSIHPTDEPHVFDVHVQLTREAGNPATWRRLNRPFLTEIRKQFLLWRALDASRIQSYVQQSNTLFNPDSRP